MGNFSSNFEKNVVLDLARRTLSIFAGHLGSMYRLAGRVRGLKVTKSRSDVRSKIATVGAINMSGLISCEQDDRGMPMRCDIQIPQQLLDAEQSKPRVEEVRILQTSRGRTHGMIIRLGHRGEEGYGRVGVLLRGREVKVEAVWNGKP